ncbi:hypothetical protein [Emticicia aquatica]|uniref:hypothetical protein n=1 Tax=Emticicia aquatica TaxID=1681835 RepID=UPI001EEB36BC|nr:hypothetical protein [Emticicia aquatica]
METPESEKSKAHIIVEIIENLPKMVVSKTIIRKTTVSASKTKRNDYSNSRISHFQCKRTVQKDFNGYQKWV